MHRHPKSAQYLTTNPTTHTHTRTTLAPRVLHRHSDTTSQSCPQLMVMGLTTVVSGVTCTTG